MKKKWESSYEWELNKNEKYFDKKLKENGFEIIGVRMYMSKTDWKVKKDGIECEFSIYHEAGVKSNLCWKAFMNYFEIKSKVEKIRQEV